MSNSVLQRRIKERRGKVVCGWMERGLNRRAAAAGKERERRTARHTNTRESEAGIFSPSQVEFTHKCLFDSLCRNIHYFLPGLCIRSLWIISTFERQAEKGV